MLKERSSSFTPKQSRLAHTVYGKEEFELHVFRKTYYDFVIHSFFIILFYFFNRKSAKAIIILISLLGMIYLLVFYLPGNNSSNEYFVAVVYPLQVRQKKLATTVIRRFSRDKSIARVSVVQSKQIILSH